MTLPTSYPWQGLSTSLNLRRKKNIQVESESQIYSLSLSDFPKLSKNYVDEEELLLIRSKELRLWGVLLSLLCSSNFLLLGEFLSSGHFGKKIKWNSCFSFLVRRKEIVVKDHYNMTSSCMCGWPQKSLYFTQKTNILWCF